MNNLEFFPEKQIESQAEIEYLKSLHQAVEGFPHGKSGGLIELMRVMMEDPTGRHNDFASFVGNLPNGDFGDQILEIVRRVLVDEPVAEQELGLLAKEFRDYKKLLYHN
jgi:hypothetical protein